MREFDHDGLILSRKQAQLFELSLEKVKCSSEIFIRRFMNSKVVHTFDTTAFLDDNATTDNIFDEIEKEYGESEYGNNKYDNDEIYWIGYIYRYFSYTYELSSSYIYKLIKPNELRRVYYPYHTMDPKMAIERILEAKNIDLSVEGLNKKAYEIIKKVYKNSEINLIDTSHLNLLNEKPKSYGNEKERICFDIIQQEKKVGKIGLKFLNDSTIQMSMEIKDNLADRYFIVYDSLKQILKKYNQKITTCIKKKVFKVDSFIDLGFKIISENDLYYTLIKE